MVLMALGFLRLIYTYNPGQKSWDKCVLVALYKHAKQRVARELSRLTGILFPSRLTYMKSKELNVPCWK